MDEPKPVEPGAEEAQGWEPVGLAAAAEELEAGQAAVTPELERKTIPAPWSKTVGWVLDVVFGRLERRDPVWKLEAAERDGLSQVWGDYLAEAIPHQGPLLDALIVSGAVFGPRLGEIQAKRRRAQLEEGAQAPA